MVKQKKYILAIDQGTTGSRAILFDTHGKSVASAYREIKQYYPHPGWVEHDAQEIWESCVSVIKKAMAKAKIKSSQVVSIGITNQRETTVLWDRKTSKPVARAIVWQCRRTADICERLKQQWGEAVFQRRTGLVLDPYFSGTKIKWYLDHIQGLRKKVLDGKICFGTIDSWLVWKLTGGKSHATDFTNASRTLIFNIQKKQWDKDLLKILGIPATLLPDVKVSGSVFGRTEKGVAGLSSEIPITAVLGDQQAALYGQGCFSTGSIKNTYGTGCFIVLNTGKKIIHSKKGLLTTIAVDDKGHPVYAMEGSVFIAGAVVQWLRDELKVLKSAQESEEIAQSVTHTNGVYLVPAFTGLGAPYWDSQARGVISGLTRGANMSHIIRAALESMAYQTKDVFDIMQKESGCKIKELKVDGGASGNNFLMQFQADILNCSITRPCVTESTALGVALLAGVTAGIWKGKKDLEKAQKKDKVFMPTMSASQRKTLYEGWQRAVKRLIVNS